jgi:hypothetical protein
LVNLLGVDVWLFGDIATTSTTASVGATTRKASVPTAVVALTTIASITAAATAFASTGTATVHGEISASVISRHLVLLNKILGVDGRKGIGGAKFEKGDDENRFEKGDDEDRFSALLES